MGYFNEKESNEQLKLGIKDKRHKKITIPEIWSKDTINTYKNLNNKKISNAVTK